ncbi:MAG: hypothetical protein HKN81_01970 [Gammaproteobacteria bacterium]|nr:hypothetical protein [Gammaproteobacteria bacterium]
MQMSMLVTFEDGRTEKLSAGPAQIVRFERQFKVGVGRAFAPIDEGGEGMRFEHALWLAHNAAISQAKRDGSQAPPPFDVWLEDVADVDMLTDEDTSGPHPLD